MTILSRSTQLHSEEPARRWAVWLARTLWLLVLLVIAALYIEMVPRNLVQTRFEWTIQQAMDAVAYRFPFSFYVRLVVAVEYVVVTVYIGAALLIFWKFNEDPFAIFVSAALLLLSTLFGISGNQDALHFPAALGWPAGWLEQLVPLATLTSFLLLFYLLPDGRFAPAWLAWAAIPSLLIVLIPFDNPRFHRLTAPWPALDSGEIALLLLAVVLAPLLVGPARHLLVRSLPDHGGTLRKERWLWLVALALPIVTLGLLAFTLWDDKVDELGWSIFIWVMMTSMVVGLASQIYRYVTETDPLRRQQIKWLAWGMASPLLGIFFGLIVRTLVGDPSLYFALDNLYYPLLTTLIPISILFSILRYRLWGIDTVLSRTLVYGGLTLLIALLYMLVVGVLSVTLRNGVGLTASILATGLIALLFHPMRQGLQRLANRLIYGERDDPATVLARLGRRLEGTVAPDAVLPTIVETVAQALKLPYAAIALRQKGEETIVIAYGEPDHLCESFPLSYQGEALGRLDVASRADGESLIAGDRRLLSDIALQAGPAVHAMQLTAELQRSRIQLVTAREEERRRLRRDLHDGLGPQLAGLSMKIDAARNQLRSNPEVADRLLTQYKEECQGALADLRRLVYGLRPPALDQLGLVSALNEYVAAHDEMGPLIVQIDAPASLPPLPAAVEVAAYRIALEALTNVAHHAGATTCRIELRAEDALYLTISDDGIGIAPGVRQGVGLTSMCERAIELGGSCEVVSRETGGTHVSVHLPLVLPEEK